MVVLLVGFIATRSHLCGWVAPDLRSAALIGATALCVGLGTLFMIAAMRAATLAQIAPFRYSALVFAAFAGMLFWREFPSPLSLAGVVLIVLGGIIGALTGQRHGLRDRKDRAAALIGVVRQTERLPPGQYVVTGGREVTSILTVDEPDATGK